MNLECSTALWLWVRAQESKLFPVERWYSHLTDLRMQGVDTLVVSSEMPPSLPEKITQTGLGQVPACLPLGIEGQGLSVAGQQAWCRGKDSIHAGEN